jgi:lipopolysaccharide export system protein LptA
VRWQHPARVGVALLGIGCAAAVWHYGRRAPRPVIDNKPPAAVLTDQTVQARGSGVKKFRISKGQEVLEIEAAVETAYTGGRTRLERVRFKSTKEGGKGFEIWAGLAESEGKAVTGDEPGLIYLSGNVRTKTSDGLEINTESATYDNIQGLATIPGKLTFTRGRLRGEGVGATYDRDRDVLWLLDEAHVRREPGDGQGLLDASAKGIGIARPDRYMNIRENAKIIQPDQTLTADQIIVHFTDDERGAELLEMHGNARVTPAASAKKGAPDMQSDDITLEFQEDGQTLRHAMMAGRSRVVQSTDTGRQTIAATTIDLVTGADGLTLRNVEAKGGDVEATLPPAADRPERTIRSATLVASGDDAGLRSALFEGGVSFVESAAARGARAGGRGGAPPSTRNATSEALALVLGGELGAIEKAEFRRKVVFNDGNMKAIADLAEHDEKLGILVLTPAPGGAPVSVNDGIVDVRALWIQVALSTHDLRAKDRIQVVMAQGRSAQAGRAQAPALFDAAKPIRGVATNLKYVSASREATFVGTPAARARVYQTEGTGSANEDIRNVITSTNQIVVSQESGNLMADGLVESQFLLDRPGESAGRGRPGAAAKSAAAPAARGTTPAAAPAARGAASAAPKDPTTRIKADKMEYIDKDRRVVYTAEPTKLATLIGPDDNVEARQIVLTLAPAERALKTLEATGAMWASFVGGREAMGDKMIYDAISEKHVITGKPMLFKSVQIDAGKPSCTLETSTEVHYEGKDQTINVPADAANTSRPTEPMPCTTSLKTFKK